MSIASSAETRKHYRTCNLCEAMCGIEITLEGDTIRSIKGDKNDPFSKGHICPKATALQDIYHDPDRLKYPLRRTADGWEQIGWDEAFDEVAANIKRVQATYGNKSVGAYLGNPNVHNLGAMLFGAQLLRALRSTSRFSATSVDQLPHHYAALQMFGHQLLMPVPDVDRTDYFLVIGANPLASNGSLMSAGGIEPRMKALRKRGGKIVVIDPRRTETARMADAYYAIRPGSDALLLLAIIHTLYKENWVAPGKLAEFTVGFETLKGVTAAYSPERVASATGISADAIRTLAQELASAESAAIYTRMGTSTQRFGGLCTWLGIAINVLTGNLDRPGGMMFTTPAVDTVTPQRRGKLNRWTTRVRKLPEFGGELPVSGLAEDMLTPGDDQIRAMVTVAGNPVLSTPNGGQLDEAFANLDFYVAIDIYINETTRHANIILPPTTGLECDHYDVSFHYLAVRNSSKFSQALFEKDDNQRHDWQITRELVKRLATEDKPFDDKNPLNSATPRQMIDYLLQTGPHDLTLDDLLDNPHGVDLGPLREQLPDRLFTADEQINLAPDVFLDDLGRLEDRFFGGDNSDADQLLLIGRRHLRDNNSWMHNSKRLVKGKNRCTVMVNPADAARHAVANGETVRVRSRVGSVELPAEVSADVMPGVVCIPHGWGHNKPGMRMAVASAHAGVSVNDLTDELEIDELTGNAILNGVAVTLEKI